MSTGLHVLGHPEHLSLPPGPFPMAGRCRDPRGMLSPPREAAAALGWCLLVQLGARASAFCENRNSGAGELSLGSIFRAELGFTICY